MNANMKLPLTNGNSLKPKCKVIPTDQRKPARIGYLVFSSRDFTSKCDYCNLFWKVRFREKFQRFNGNLYKINDICRPNLTN
jgi:hypothetical protein